MATANIKCPKCGNEFNVVPEDLDRISLHYDCPFCNEDILRFPLVIHRPVLKEILDAGDTEDHDKQDHRINTGRLKALVQQRILVH